MTVHKLTAGTGYTYLTDQVATGDYLRDPNRELTDYYVVDGQPAGQWFGSGAQILGLKGEVTEEQMEALFGEGRHPNADQLIAEAMEQGATLEEAMHASQLGRAYPQLEQTEDDGWNDAIKKAYEEFRVTNDRNPDAGVERDLLRWNTAGKFLAEGISDVERHRFLAERGREQRQAVAGFDLVFTPAKSVSVLWAIGDEHTQKAIKEAHDAAWQKTIEWVEKEGCVTRRGAKGIAQESADGLTAAAFEHHDSRAGDPNLHTHVAISAKVRASSDGQWNSLDARVLYSLNVAASEQYNARIEQEISNRLGLKFEDVSRGRGKRAVREIAGVSSELVRSFSSRRQSIEAEYDRRLQSYRERHGTLPSKKVQYAMRQEATLSTRQAKGEIKRLSEQRIGWQKQAHSILGSRKAVREMLDATRTAEKTSTYFYEVTDGLSVDLATCDLGQVVEHITTRIGESHTTWTTWTVQAECSRVARGLVAVHGGNVADVTQELSAAVHRTGLISVEAPAANQVPYVMRRRSGESIYTIQGGGRFTSQKVLDNEDYLLKASTTERSVVVEKTHLTSAIKHFEHRQGRTLNDGQRALAESFACSPRALVAGIGPAGSGKTSAMAAMAAAVTHSGGNVIALAPSVVAADVLGTDIGAPAHTLHKFLLVHNEWEHIPAEYRLTQSSVILVDEAGMAGTGRLADIQRVADQYGARVRLLGDPAQLSSVDAGGALRMIANRTPTVTLTQVHRFKDPAEAKASLLIRDGVPEGIAYYADRGRLIGGARAGMLEEIFANWETDTRYGKNSLMVATTNEEVAQLNSQARIERISNKLTHPGRNDIQLHDGTLASRGDIVVTRFNQSSLTNPTHTKTVRNGDLWQVLRTRADGSMLVKDPETKAKIVLPAEYVAEHVELGYATTAHRTQGITVDSAHVLVDSSIARENLYVALTRGKEMNRMYAVTDSPVAYTSEYAPTPASAAQDIIELALLRENAEKAATDHIQDNLNYEYSLEKLIPEYKDAYTRLLDPELRERMQQAILDGMTPERGARVLADESWPALEQRLMLHEASLTTDGQGNVAERLADIVREAEASRDFNDARSAAQIMHYRVAEPDVTHLDRSLPPGIPMLSAEPLPGQHAEVHAWLSRHVDLIRSAYAELRGTSVVEPLSVASETKAHHQEQPQLKPRRRVAFEEVATESRTRPTIQAERNLPDPERRARIQQAILDGMTPVRGARVLADESWPALEQRLIQHEAQLAKDGHGNVAERLARMVRDAESARDFDDARSAAQIMHYRVGDPEPRIQEKQREAAVNRTDPSRAAERRAREQAQAQNAPRQQQRPSFGRDL
ncbi:MobF family relaxase [Lysinibacter sp. HNR]|uniref:MobF family relaxase n=1 Tax=Lysinibacter sp. HNR TaxID=3031408 RepID=UPI002434F120|nr:MobF family relaxase [Lysinibacter sp. HNR]WGD37571.1 MobF family relaxase [Lysinibacter sp. HNR]